jgi:hypothetical protein
MKRSASGDSAGNGNDAGSASLDPAYGKYVPRRFPAESRNRSLFTHRHFLSTVGRMKRSTSGDSAGNGNDAGSASLDPAYEKYVPRRFSPNQEI